MSKPRGRFDILVTWGDDGAYVRFKSDPKRSLPATEIVACLREYIDMIDAGIEAEASAKRQQERTP